MILASVGVAVRHAGSCEFSGPILLEQQRDEADPPTSFDVATTFDRSLWDAIFAAARWVGGDLEFDGSEIIVGRGVEITFEEGMEPGQQATLRFKLVGDRWAIPSSDYVPPPPDTCPATPQPGTTRTPRSYGNKPTTFEIKLGASPRKMQSWRLFQGQSLQKSNQGQVAVVGEMTCVDDSILYADKALCYQLPPFSGRRRDEIVRDVAALVGLRVATSSGVGFGRHGETSQVIVPRGTVVNKPILLSNASLLPFVNELGAAENWFASFDEFGRLFVRVIDRKESPIEPDWTLDEALGDFDYDTIEEVPPSKPATRVFVTVAEPVRGTGPGGSDLEITTITTEEEADLHAPECVKVRPSGHPSFLFGDGSYRTIEAEELMVTVRKVTELTTRNGLEIRRLTRLSQFYNPKAYDPNFDTDPPGTDYDAAYGNQTFHRDEAETLIEVSEDLIETTLDIYGTKLAQVETIKAWYAPHRAAVYVPGGRTKLQNDAGATPPAYVYAGGTTRTLTAEEYGVVSKSEKSYVYGEDGSLLRTLERRYGYFSPDSRSDVVVTETVPDDGDPTSGGGPDTPPPENPPPPAPPESNPAWHPLLSGPVFQQDGKFTFRVSIAGAPANVLTSTVALSGHLIPPNGGVPPPYGTGPGGGFGTLGSGDTALLIPGSQEEGFVSIRISGPRQAGLFYVSLTQLNWSGDQTSNRFANTIVFDPWAGVPDGGSL